MRINRASGLKRLTILAAALGLLSLANPAAAQYITYVATNGNDANPCTVITAPCKTLQRAVNVTTANGTVRVLTPLTSSVFINKSITISGDGVPIVGQITIGGATAVVRLRGLLLDGVGGYVNGVNITSAAAVHIEDCTIERYTGDAILLVTTAATKLFISDTIASTSSDGLYADAYYAEVAIENSHFDQNNSSGVYLKVNEASVTGSSASGNAQHGFILLSGRTRITETAADSNSGSGFAVRNDGLVGDTMVHFASAKAQGNGAMGLHIEPGGLADINDCVFLRGSNTAVFNQGQLYTYENNAIEQYSGAAATPVEAL